MIELPKREEYAPLIRKNILVGLTASSSIYKSIDLIRKLIRMGANVRVVMTKESLSMIGSHLVEWASGAIPYVEFTGKAEHVSLANWSDALIIAPATLNTMARIAYGIADQLLHLTAIAMTGLGKRIIILPSMNMNLYNSKQYRDVEHRLRSYGNVFIIKPLIEEGKAKYPPLEDLVHCVDALINRNHELAGKRILVTAGPTVEHIDPVRIISNLSSGLMGVLIAREAACRGAIVDLVHGPLRVEPPFNVDKYPVFTTASMAKTISRLTSKYKYDAAIFAAAPADFTVAVSANKKIPTREVSGPVVRLRPTPKTVNYVSKTNRPEIIVIFVAETVDDHLELLEKARMKIREYKADYAVANVVGKGHAGFSSRYIDACIVSKKHHDCLGLVRKEIVARRIVDIISERLAARPDQE